MQYKHPFKLLDSIVKERALNSVSLTLNFVLAELEKYI